MYKPNLSNNQKMIIGGILGAGALIGGKYYFTGGSCKVNRDLTDQVIIITGANVGIGLETARTLAQQKCKLILATRDKQKTDPVVEELKKESNNQNIEHIPLDLSSLASIKEFVKTFLSKYDKLNILINNAGIMALPERKVSADGYELQFATNHLGHFYLTTLLLDVMKKSGPGRIINVSSKAHERGKMNWEDLNWEKKYNEFQVYGQSKLANIIFSKELQKRLDAEKVDIKVVSLHPGVVRTELGRNLATGFKIGIYALYPFWWYFTKNPEQGAQTTLHCVLEAQDKIVGGAYYSDCKEKDSNAESKKEEDWKKLWEVSEELIKAKLPNAYEN